MSKAFAEKIIASMVDESGHCGGRGISEKQFDIIINAMTDFEEGEKQDLGQWEGDYKTVCFWGIDYTGNVGPYRVVLNKHFRFHMGYNVENIELRPAEEYEAELEFERWLKEMRDFSHSQWVAEPKKRLDLTLTLVDVCEFEGYSYSYYDDGITYLYKFRDADGNCIVWKTKKYMWEWKSDDDDDDMWDMVTVKMRATVKAHEEYRGTKQTVIARPKIA